MWAAQRYLRKPGWPWYHQVQICKFGFLALFHPLDGNGRWRRAEGWHTNSPPGRNIRIYLDIKGYPGTSFYILWYTQVSLYPCIYLDIPWYLRISEYIPVYRTISQYMSLSLGEFSPFSISWLGSTCIDLYCNVMRCPRTGCPLTSNSIQVVSFLGASETTRKSSYVPGCPWTYSFYLFLWHFS